MFRKFLIIPGIWVIEHAGDIITDDIGDVEADTDHTAKPALYLQSDEVDIFVP